MTKQYIVDGRIDPDLKKTNALCEKCSRDAFDWEGRKTSSTFRAMKAAAGVLLEPGYPPELSPEVAVLAKLLAECRVSQDNHCYYRMFEVHYCQGGSSAQKAVRLGVPTSGYYVNLGKMLAYFQGRLQERGVFV